MEPTADRNADSPEPLDDQRPDELPDEEEVRRIIRESENAIRSRPAGISSAFSEYLHDLQRYPVLDPDDEYSLAVEAEKGSRKAQEALVRHNLRFVITVARKHAAHGVQLEDLVQEGNIGLLKAVTKFRPEFGVKFISYGVYWIKQSIRAALADQQRAVRLPINRASELARLRRATTALKERNGRDPTPQEIATEAGVRVDMARDLLQVGQGELSLDAPPPYDDEGGLTLADRIPHDEDIEERIERRWRSWQVDRALGRLRDRDAVVLRHFFGLDGGRELTLEEIGQILGVTRERIRQIRDRALRELRNLYGADLKDFIDPKHLRSLDE